MSGGDQDSNIYVEPTTSATKFIGGLPGAEIDRKNVKKENSIL